MINDNDGDHDNDKIREIKILIIQPAREAREPEGRARFAR